MYCFCDFPLKALQRNYRATILVCTTMLPCTRKSVPGFVSRETIIPDICSIGAVPLSLKDKMKNVERLFILGSYERPLPECSGTRLRARARSRAAEPRPEPVAELRLRRQGAAPRRGFHKSPAHQSASRLFGLITRRRRGRGDGAFLSERFTSLLAPPCITSRDLREFRASALLNLKA